MEIACVPAIREKIRSRESYGYWETLIKPYENEGSENPDAWVQIHLHNDNALRPIGTVWNPLQSLGILKTCLCRSAVERGGTSAPAAKSYGY